MRQCREHGVVVEHILWIAGKRPVTTAMIGLLLAGRGGSAAPRHDFCSASIISTPFLTPDSSSEIVFGEPCSNIEAIRFLLFGLRTMPFASLSRIRAPIFA